MIKQVKAHLHPGQLADVHLIRATLLASYCGGIEQRAKLFLDWILSRGAGRAKKTKQSSRPLDAATLKDREKINAYSEWIKDNFLKDASADQPMTMPDGTLSSFC